MLHKSPKKQFPWTTTNNAFCSTAIWKFHCRPVLPSEHSEGLPLLQVPSARVLHCRAVPMAGLSLLLLCQHTCSWVVRTWSVERTHLKALHFNRCFLLHHFSDLVYANKWLPLQFLTSSNWLLLPSWITKYIRNSASTKGWQTFKLRRL